MTKPSLLARREDARAGCTWTPPEYGTYAYATSDGRKRDPSEEPVKQSDHVFGATRCALHTELGEHAATEAYLAEMQEYVGLGRDERDALGVLPS